ncbi:Interferon-induced very large GTPase 1 [Anabarilius grahami]|uniref:Interferon-induced very large GTPase 1 n=1 Tax=Anabarilius grahami TaxID=495550 RepID=A0A3N0YX16_ANAGA|nr:Interferon-induced very large GTPase 1 [Anabarilius grahami]
MAVFHCADGFLKQLMVTKLSQCQYALPLLVPDPFTQQIVFPLWTFRRINKSWKKRNTNNETISQTCPVYKAQTPMVSFFRFGSVSSSKSQLMNPLINEKHNTFFNRNCPGSSRTRVLMDGVVEIAWFCPSGKDTDKFNDCVAFCNLHGDAGDHEKQLEILTEMASVNVVLLPQLDRNDRHAAIMQNLYKDKKPLICLFTEDESTVNEMKRGKFKIGLKDRNQSDVSEELRRTINACLSESSSTFRLEDVSKHSDIRVDEEDDEDCKRGREAAEQMMSLLEKKDLTEIKESFLPHQGKLWHQWSQKNKELHRPQKEEIEFDISGKQTEMNNIRKQQHESNSGRFMKFFIEEMTSNDKHDTFFLKWLRILLDEYISADLSALHHKYNEKWSTVVKLKESHDKSEQLKTEQTELEKISEEFQAATFGLEHIMREISQIYESCSSVKQNKKDLQVHFSSLPSLAAEMMISGFPLELMDGDAAHVPLIWISAVLDELIQKLKDQKVFVLSVLGLQSSGKSTMLNAMFGLQFAVSAGRCTRGAFMQLVRVSDEMRTQMNFGYILVVDTEGHHDNELATFVAGLGNLTLINIYGENPPELQDILQIVVQAFMRLKKVRLNPRCVFVHQNFSDVRAGEKNMEGRKRLQETLNEMTKLAAKEEDYDAELFSDVIRFDVQKDVKYFAQLWEGNPPMAPPNPNYCENIQDLKETIMFHAANSHGMMLTHLKVCIKDLWEALLNEQFSISFRNSLEISAYRKLETEYSKWSWRLCSAMMETENKLHNKTENEEIHEVDETDLQRELKKTSEEVEKSMSEFFKKDRDKDILIQWKTSFEIKINELQEITVREAKRKLNEILQQRHLKKEIDDQRTNHENTLYEKSKELAIKLKHKANDEKTLKKKFDFLWKQSVKKIIRDTPPIKDIDIMRDVRKILSDIYGSVSVDHWKVSRDIFSVLGYYDYVKVKRSSGFLSKAIRLDKKRLDYALSKENEAQIRSLVTDVAQQTDRMIQSFNIAKMGYNINYIQQLTIYTKTRVREHQDGPVNYEFKKQFFMDLVLSIFKRANKMITDQHRLFKEANDPVLYLERKREEYYCIFQKYCHGATSAAIFGEIICQKLKEPIEQSVYMKTARDLTDEMRSNCQSLNGNRSNLEKHILKTLAEDEDIDKYMNYIQNPRDHFKSFIRDEVSRYITDKFSVSVLPKMKENIKLQQQKIMKAAHESTEHVQVNSGDVDLWLKSFTQKLSDELIFSEKVLSGVNHDDVDVNLLEDVIRQELPAIIFDISSQFKTFPIILDFKFRPDEILIDHLCRCCWVQCPFCRAICTNTIENHDGDHSVPFHRVTGITGIYYRGTRTLPVEICTSMVASRNLYFYPNASDDLLLCREYRRAGGVYADWSITPDLSELPYWKWFVCKFQKDLEKHYNKTFEEKGTIPDEWRKYSKQEAIGSLDQYISDSPENTKKCLTGNRFPEQMTDDSTSNDSVKSCAEEELIQNFIQKLLMMDYRARYINVNKDSEQDHTQQRHSDSSEVSGDIFKAMSLLNQRTSQSEQIHPMDVQMAVFHCADGFLKQLMVTKLSQCQYALPLLVPDPFTRQIEFPLWTFRQINKSWRIRNTNNETISQTCPVYKAQTPMVSFFRFGTVSSSKSQLMNPLINEKHNTFFHRNCPGSSRTRVLMDGVVEIAWFCPSGSYDDKNTDKFTDCVAFCNLHGDAGDHEKQLQILTEMASVNVVLLQQLDRNDRHAAIMQNLYKDKKPLICLFTEDESTVNEMKRGKFKINLKDRNKSDVSEELRRAINDCLSESSSTFRLEDVSKHSDIRVDEEDDEDCKRGREAAEQMMSLLEKKDLTEIKESVLPHQGKLWHQWSQKNKELHRSQEKEIEFDISGKHTEMKNIRKQQHESNIGEFMKLFIIELNSADEHEKIFFLKWLRILLYKYTSADFSDLHHKYNEKWSTVLKLKENTDKSEQLKAEQTEFEKISEEFQAATFGLEHIMREIGQIYESCSSVKQNKKDLQFHFSSLPSLAAEMMISGFPLELMDGDAAHVPLIWISAVLDELIQKLKDQKVFVLSVLGLQSSGKSTMLNAMFGLQFAVSAGRCTRGAFMQMVKVSKEMRTQINFDYILVVDTEGLRALELAGGSTRHQDNELATFVAGLGNLTLINIFGENPSEMQDILQIVVQAFMRMKKVRLNPRCLFVHQNVSDVTAVEKNMEGRRRLRQTLDKMTKLTAEEEICDAECFSDVIRFDVQKDVKYFAQLWEGNPPMAPPNPKYCENIQELMKTIMSHAANSHGMMLTHLKVCIKNLWEALLNEQFSISFRNSLEISAYRKLETEYSKWSWSLRSAMMETENKLHNKIENEAIHEVEETDLQRELKKTSEEVEKSMSEFFEKDTYADILIQWKTSFKIIINELQENIVRETKRKLNEILQQRHLKKEIDDQRTNHENTLYEKSKELALKLKDKTNDEKTLKKKFDLFWKQSVKKIIRDTPPIKDIDIMRDVRKILSDIYGSVSVDHWKVSRDIFSVLGYYDYIKVKRSSGFFTNAIRSSKERLGYALSKENEVQIRSLVTDVALQTKKLIQSFNIAKMGYNIICIQQLTGYIKKRVTEHQDGPVNYEFKKQFFMDLVLSICKRENEMITDQHRLFKECNDPVIYVEKKREDYYSIFQKNCHKSTSAAIFGEIICQKLKDPIEQSVYKKTARDLTDEMRSNCQSLNGNRSKLEKHILKTLAEEEDFNKYMNYIHNPRDHFKSFIRDEVSRYITDKFSVSVLPKMKENIELLQQKIMKVAHESTEHVQVNSGDVGLWLKSFTQKLSDELIFSEKDLSGVKPDVDDFNLLEDVIRQELLSVMFDISSRFNTEKFPVNLDYKFRPDELLVDHFCRCCWVQCPFCRAICTNTIENHDGDHNVPFHRVTGIAGLIYMGTRSFSIEICTSAVASSSQYFYHNASDENVLWREHRTAGGVYADWTISPDLSELPYWKWFVCRFKKDLEKHYNKSFEGKGEIPDEWRKYSKQEAIESSNQYS